MVSIKISWPPFFVSTTKYRQNGKKGVLLLGQILCNFRINIDTNNEEE